MLERDADPANHLERWLSLCSAASRISEPARGTSQRELFHA
jgi:hypothetical protein